MALRLLFFLLIVVSVSCSYLPEPYADDQDLILQENANYILLTSSSVDHTKSGIIFYPGGLVDPHSYILALRGLVLVDNRTVVILKTTSNLAILNTKKASSLINEITDTKRWVVGGHSLGGSVSCIDVFNNPNDFVGLFLLAAYSVNDLSESALPIISITASQDNILDFEKFEENRANLPAGITVTSSDQISDSSTSGSTIYYEIEGGNHGQFGNYGDQKGDGIPLINSNSQQLLVTSALRKFFLSNNL